MRARRSWPWPLVLVVCGIACLSATAPAQSRAAHAQGEGVSLEVAAGWNLVAAPTGQELTGATGPQYAYGADGTGYVVVNPGELVGGRGVWAFFPVPTTVPLGATAASFTRALTAPDQWELLGNPSTSQTLPISGADAALAYDPATGYRAVSELIPGQAAWVISHTGGAITVGTPPSGAAADLVTTLQQELFSTPTDRGTFDQVATVTAELVGNRQYDQVQEAQDELRSAFEDGLRVQGASAFGEMTSVQIGAAVMVRQELVRALGAASSGNTAGADQAVAAAQQAAAASEADGLAQASGPGPGSAQAALRYAGLVSQAGPSPAQLAGFGSLLRAGFFAISLGQAAPQSFWDAATGLVSTPPATAGLPLCMGTRVQAGQTLDCAAPAGLWTRQVFVNWRDSTCPGTITVTFSWGDGSEPTTETSTGPCSGMVTATHVYNTTDGETETYIVTTDDPRLPNPFLTMNMTFEASVPVPAAILESSSAAPSEYLDFGPRAGRFAKGTRC